MVNCHHQVQEQLDWMKSGQLLHPNAHFGNRNYNIKKNIEGNSYFQNLSNKYIVQCTSIISYLLRKDFHSLVYLTIISAIKKIDHLNINNGKLQKLALFKYY